MDRKRIQRSLNELQSLADLIERSQKFGQPLPSGTTKTWGEQLTSGIAGIRQGLGIESPLSKNKKAATSCILAIN